MSSTVPPETQAYAAPPNRLTFTGLVLSEWIKFWSVRSIVVPMILAAVCTVGVSVLLAAIIVAVSEDPSAGMEGAGMEGAGMEGASGLSVAASLTGAQLATLIVAVIGVLVITSEYSTGSIRTSFAAAPRRAPVLWAKAVVLTVAISLTLGTAVCVAFLAGQAILATINGGVGIGEPQVLRVLLGNILVLTGTALAGLGLGAMLRSAAGAICTLVGLLFVLPILLLSLPDFWGKQLLVTYNFANTTPALTTLDAEPGTLSFWASAIAFSVWVVLFLLAGALVLRRRDV